MSDLRTDLKENTDKLREMSSLGRKEEKEKTKKTIIKQAKLRNYQNNHIIYLYKCMIEYHLRSVFQLIK